MTVRTPSRTTDARRALALLFPLDTGFSIVTALAYLHLTGRSFAEARGALLLGWAVKLIVLLAGVLVPARPIRRWRRAPPEAREGLVAAAWLASDRAPLQTALVQSLGWATVYLLVTALLPGRPRGAWPIALLFSGGLGAGALALSYTTTRTLLAPAAHDLSLEADAHDIALPPSRARFRQHLAIITLAVGVAPNLWMSSLALALGRDATSVLTFSLIALLWIPIAAWFQATAVATPLSQITHVIQRISDAPAAAASLPATPVFSRDELGQLARNVNALSRRLSATLHEIDAKRQLLDAVLRHTPIGIALIDAREYRFRFFNPAYERIVPGRLLLGQPLPEVIPEAAEAARRDFAEVARTGTHLRIADEHFLMQLEGKPVDLWITREIVPVWRDGTLDGILIVIEDTTARVQARQRIEELATLAQRRAAELQGVLDNMVDAVIVCDAGGRFTDANRAYHRLIGVEQLDPDVVQAAARLRVFGGLDGHRMSSAELPLGRALRGETVSSVSLTLERGQQRLEVRGSAAPIRDRDGRIVGAVGVYRDVTELVELDRLKDQFIRAAAHELKTPVAVMKTRAQTLLQTRQVDEALRKALEGIDRGADRIAVIVRDLLELSEAQLRRLHLVPHTSDLVPVIDAALARAAALSPRHHLRRSGLDQAPLPVDASRIAGVLDRLLHNAVKYSPDGGEVDVTVEREDHAVRVSVRDHGIGIPAAQQPRVFECFYRAHAETPFDAGGLGVGLFLARAIVELHGGVMGFDSREGAGSTFWFRLPAGP